MTSEPDQNGKKVDGAMGKVKSVWMVRYWDGKDAQATLGKKVIKPQPSLLMIDDCRLSIEKVVGFCCCHRPSCPT